MPQNKFFTPLLILLLAFGFQHAAKTVFGWSPDFALGAVITFSLFFGFIEIAFIGLVGVFILNWQPQFSPEALMFIALPLLIVAVKKYFPWRIELNHILLVFAGLVIFYGVSNYGSFSADIPLFLKIAGSTLLFSALVFQIFNYFYKIKEI